MNSVRSINPLPSPQLSIYASEHIDREIDEYIDTEIDSGMS
jgi:hypothetical protein